MKAIIFDMDGTMVDNMMIHNQAWQIELKQLGIDMSIEEIKEKIHGVNVELLEKNFGDRFTPQQRVDISKQKELRYQSIFAKTISLIDGLEDLLKELEAAEIPLAIGTAAPPENVAFVLKHLPIKKYFKSILHSDDVAIGKPDPEIFIKSAQNLGVNIKECLVFEDSITGAETAMRAGCETIIVTTAHDEKEFSNFNHIKKFIKDYSDINLQYLRENFNF